MASTSKSRKPAFAEVATLPPEATARLYADVDLMSRRMARRIAQELVLPPGLSRTAVLRSLITACQDALRVLLRRLHDGRGPRAGDLDRLAAVGAHQAETSVPLELLLSAYRVAAKLVWEEVVGGLMRENEMTPGALIGLASEIFDYLDEISGAVGAAYIERRERLLRQRDRDRDRVLQRLLAGDTSPDLRLAAAANDLELAPPYRVIACGGPGDVDRVVERVWRPAGALVTAMHPGVWVILLDAAADHGRLCADALAISGDLAHGVGPVAATLADVASAAEEARRALEIGRRLEPERRFHDHVELGIFAALDADHEALRRFCAALLGPLLDDDSRRAGDLLATLEALVETAGLGEAAASLGLHRHTVVYRVQRLRELGLDVDDPGRRHLLWLALRARRLLAA